MYELQVRADTSIFETRLSSIVSQPIKVVVVVVVVVVIVVICVVFVGFVIVVTVSVDIVVVDPKSYL